MPPPRCLRPNHHLIERGLRYNQTMTDTFGPVAEDYDRWYDSAEGEAVLTAEIASLRMAAPSIEGRWIEIGVGTGRFAAALGVASGVDPSPSMLIIAARRGIKTVVGTGEHLPCESRSLDGLLMVATLCFAEDAARVLRECYRVLRPRGTLLVGHIPADGPWGQSYLKKAETGHPLYSRAQFTTVNELIRLASMAGFTLQAAASTLFWPPGSTSHHPPRVERGLTPGAGFAALKLAPSAN